MAEQLPSEQRCWDCGSYNDEGHDMSCYTVRELPEESDVSKDIPLRLQALELAGQHTLKPSSPEDVTKRASVYLEFLTGNQSEVARLRADIEKALANHAADL